MNSSRRVPTTLIRCALGTSLRGRRHRARRGVLIIMITFLLPVVIVIAGFAVDLGYMQLSRTELRAATDVAAKAAAQELSHSQDFAAASQAAITTASRNDVGGVPVTLQSGDIEFGRATPQANGAWSFSLGGTPPNAVRVTAERNAASPDGPVGLFFGRFVGRTSFEPSVTAVSAFIDVDICLVLDRSSSMKLATDDTSPYMSGGDPRSCWTPQADSRWVALEGAVQLFVNRLQATGADEHVAVVTFGSDDYSPCGETNTDASIDQHLSSDLSLAQAAMAARSSSVWNGNTLIDEGIDLGIDVLTDSGFARPQADKIMIVFTDGHFTGDDPIPDAADARSQGITVHTVTYSTGANQTHMASVAAAGGGHHYHAPDVATLNDIFEKLAAVAAILTE